MKKLLVCSTLLLMALPLTARAEIDSVSDVKGYSEQTANFNVGIFDVSSVTTTNTITDTHEWFVYGNNVGTFDPCLGGACGMIQSRGFDTTSDIISDSTTRLNGPMVQGGADMSLMGGLAGCVTALDLTSVIPFAGTLTQTQNLTGNFTVNLASPSNAASTVTGTIAYTGTEALRLSVGPMP